MTAKKAKKSIKSKSKPAKKLVAPKLTHSDCARLNTLFKTGVLGDLQVSYATYSVLQKIARQVNDALLDVAKVEAKYIADGQADENYQKFVTGQNQIIKDHADDHKQLLTQHAIDNKHLTVDQAQRTQEFKALLDSVADVKIEPLTEETVPDLFTAELAASEWDTLSLVIDTQ